MSGKRKAAAPATAATSSHSTEPAAAKGLQKDVVRDFVARLQMPDRMGPTWLDDEERQEWQDYLDGEPDALDEVAAADWPLPIRMPAKCRPRPAAGACSTAAVESQVELVTYSNAGSDGRRFNRADRSRQRESAKRIALDDVPNGSTIAIQRTSEEILAPGYGTPFYLGDVQSITTSADGAVDTFTIQFRMPTAAGQLFCNDVCKPWRLACHAHHVYDGHCERKRECRLAAEKAGSQSGPRFTYTGHADEILETHLVLNKDCRLHKRTRLRLAESAPENGAWNAALGV